MSFGWELGLLYASSVVLGSAEDKVEVKCNAVETYSLLETVAGDEVDNLLDD
jgi:hypothetical protein